MTNRINWGILGNATIARKCVIPAIQNSRNGRIHALATRSPVSARDVVSENKIPQVYDNYEAVLTDPQIDAVYIPLLKALSAGKHVLCEKPLACNAGEAREMVAGAAESDRLLMEAFMYRFHPRSRRIKEIVDRSDIGSPCSIRTAFCFHMDEDILKSGGNARLKKDKGGGALMDVGCYGVSVARWLLGSEPITAQAQAVYHPDGVDVHLAGTLKFNEGRLAVIEASFISALQQTYSVVGSKGALELPHDAFVPWEKDAYYIQRKVDEETGRQHLIPGADEYQLMVEHFADAVRGQAKLLYPAEDSIANMRALDALAEAARTGNTVNV